MSNSEGSYSSSSGSEDDDNDEDMIFTSSNNRGVSPKDGERRVKGKPPIRPKKSGSPRRVRDSRKLLDTSRGLLRLSGCRNQRRSGGTSSSLDSTSSWKTQSWDKLYDGRRSKSRSTRNIRRSRGKTSNRKTKGAAKNWYEKLSTPKEKTTRRFTKQDDAKNCTFKPRIRKYRSETKEESNEDSTFDDRISRFIDRQEASERATRRALETKRGEKAYKMVKNKKVCRECGAVQSYEEVMTKKKFCPCGGKYTSDAGSRSSESRHDEFVERLSRREADRQERLKQLRRRVKAEETGGRRSLRRDGTSRGTTFHETDFLARMTKDLKKRENRRREAEKSRDSQAGLSTTLRTIRNELRRCEDRIQNAAVSSGARRAKHWKGRSSAASPDARMRRLQQQLQAAALMAQELQEEVVSGGIAGYDDDDDDDTFGDAAGYDNSRRRRGKRTTRVYERAYKNGVRSGRSRGNRRRGK